MTGVYQWIPGPSSGLSLVVGHRMRSRGLMIFESPVSVDRRLTRTWTLLFLETEGVSSSAAPSAIRRSRSGSTAGAMSSSVAVVTGPGFSFSVSGPAVGVGTLSGRAVGVPSILEGMASKRDKVKSRRRDNRSARDDLSSQCLAGG